VSTFKIQCTRERTSIVEIEADDIEQAIQKAYDNDSLPDGECIEEFVEVCESASYALNDIEMPTITTCEAKVDYACPGCHRNPVMVCITTTTTSKSNQADIICLDCGAQIDPEGMVKHGR
jgi:hypothetical protein